ncbi:hypothetical protein GCM10022254_76270 [Actinomadura meridiana]|uniref:Uncharacterized protein n=1 Tax=Actinomadura meridiana TaxID=559626 RepID=A0ABP8CS14_9ACTN
MTALHRDAATVRTERSVLAVAHSVTSTTRLMDAMAALDGDLRLQCYFTEIPGATVPDGVARFLSDLEVREIPWEQAVRRRFDLAVSAASSGPVDQIDAPLMSIPHGAGYNKHLGAGAQVYGLSREQLLRGGRVVPSVLVLSHEGQVRQLADQCPEALDAALVAGDPCYDRLVAGMPWRDDYRAALGVRADQRLVVVSSTWGAESLLGRGPEVPARLLADLPVDEYRVAAVFHPNVWHGHGVWQLRAWLADCRRAGLLVIPPREGWRAALVAADAVVGDHGSVTLYAAALGRPVLMGFAASGEVVAGTAMAELGRVAPVLDHRPVDAQIEATIARGWEGAGLSAASFAVQGRSSEVLRAEMYRLMDLAPPPGRVRVLPVPPPYPEPRRWEDAERPALVASVTVEEAPGRVVFGVERIPAEVADLRTTPRGGHLVVDGTETDHRLRGLADVLVRRHDAGHRPVFKGDEARTVAETSADGSCRVRVRDGCAVVVRARGMIDPGVLASVVHAWVERRRLLDDLPKETVVRIGTRVLPFTWEPSG